MQLTDEELTTLRLAAIIARSEAIIDYGNDATPEARAKVERFDAALSVLNRQQEVWTPLPNGKHSKIAGPTSIEVRADMVILENRDSILTAVFPDNIRLCRLQPKEATRAAD